MYGRRRSKQMENEQQQTSTTSVCRAGCGFYGSSATEGYCSKCFKDTLKRAQDAVRLSPTVVSSMTATSSTNKEISVAEELESCAKAVLGSDLKNEIDDVILADSAAIPSSTVLPSADGLDGSDAPAPVKKANRCLMCKKRVGLTGFTCRCGGLYCGEHRYDKAHNCDFDYKTMERETIRKNNPVVMSEKVQRI